jgi:hypothetical protein
MKSKICKICNKRKSFTEFYKMFGKELPRTYCKKCMLEYSSKRTKLLRRTNPEYRKKEIDRCINYRTNNREKYLEKARDYYYKNRKKCIQYTLNWQKKNKELLKIYSKKYLRIYRNKYPWMRTMNSIRCRVGKRKYYKNIKNYLTPTDLKILWFRDEAYNMKKPSIDREDSKKDYSLDNCRYIEFSENARIAQIKRRIQ